jgi:hypothetical protein
MPDVDGRTLMMAIQAVDAKMHVLKATIDGVDDDEDVTTVEDLLLGYEKAAEKLRAAYELACLAASNLPPYASLIRDPSHSPPG